MNKVIQFPTKEDPIEEIFENLLLDLRRHGYWEPSEESVDCEHACLMFESIQSFIDNAKGKKHPLQKLAKSIDKNKMFFVIREND